MRKLRSNCFVTVNQQLQLRCRQRGRQPRLNDSFEYGSDRLARRFAQRRRCTCQATTLGTTCSFWRGRNGLAKLPC